MLGELVPSSDEGGKLWVSSGKMAKQSTKTRLLFFGSFAATSLALKLLRRIGCSRAFRLRI